jgi:hypothetical protein
MSKIQNFYVNADVIAHLSAHWLVSNIAEHSCRQAIGLYTLTISDRNCELRWRRSRVGNIEVDGLLPRVSLHCGCR